LKLTTTELAIVVRKAATRMPMKISGRQATDLGDYNPWADYELVPGLKKKQKIMGFYGKR